MAQSTRIPKGPVEQILQVTTQKLTNAWRGARVKGTICGDTSQGLMLRIARTSFGKGTLVNQFFTPEYQNRVSH